MMTLINKGKEEIRDIGYKNVKKGQNISLSVSFVNFTIYNLVSFR